jgi:hypothetical protein
LWEENDKKVYSMGTAHPTVMNLALLGIFFFLMAMEMGKLGDLETLLFQIVFQMINYKGKYTDYGEIGHPRKSYPKEL